MLFRVTNITTKVLRINIQDVFVKNFSL